MTREQPSTSRSALIIDDSPSLRAVVRTTLAGAGFAVVEARDGRDALDRLADARYDVVVCDVHMPEMDGITFVRHFRALPAHERTPVVMLTTESNPSMRAKAVTAGASAWITKPVHPARLIDTLAVVMG